LDCSARISKVNLAPILFGGTPEQSLQRKAQHGIGHAVTMLSLQAKLLGWPTPMAPPEWKQRGGQQRQQPQAAGAIREAMRKTGADLVAIAAPVGPARFTGSRQMLTG
jgi:hypothetical protein